MKHNLQSLKKTLKEIIKDEIIHAIIDQEFENTEKELRAKLRGYSPYYGQIYLTSGRRELLEILGEIE